MTSVSLVPCSRIPMLAFVILALVSSTLSCSDAPKEKTPLPPGPIKIVFLPTPELPESVDIAAELTERLAPKKIQVTTLERPGLFNSLDLSAYHAIYIYTDTEDPRVQERFKNATMPNVFDPEKRCLILIESHPRNIPFLRGQENHIRAGGSSFSVMKQEDIHWDDNEHLEYEIEQILSVVGDDVKSAWEELTL